MAEQSSSGDREDLLRRVGQGLRTVIHGVVAAQDRAAKKEGLHPTDFACIAYLHQAGAPVSPKQIIAQMQLSSGSGTALLDRLEAAGYTRRLPNPDDRRSILIELDTKKAEEMLRRYGEIEQSYRRATQSMSERDLALVANFLESIGTVAEDL